MNDMFPGKRLLDVPECALYIGSTPLSVYQMVSKKQIPFVKMGRADRFDIAELDAWIEVKKNETQTRRQTVPA